MSYLDVDAFSFPASDERERYLAHGPGLGYVHGELVNRRLPCGIVVWPDDDGRSTPRRVSTRPGDVVTCPRCLAVLGR